MGARLALLRDKRVRPNCAFRLFVLSVPRPLSCAPSHSPRALRGPLLPARRRRAYWLRHTSCFSLFTWSMMLRASEMTAASEMRWVWCV